MSGWNMGGMRWDVSESTYRDAVESRVQWAAGGKAMLQETPDTLQALRPDGRMEWILVWHACLKRILSPKVFAPSFLFHDLCCVNPLAPVNLVATP